MMLLSLLLFFFAPAYSQITPEATPAAAMPEATPAVDMTSAATRAAIRRQLRIYFYGVSWQGQSRQMLQQTIKLLQEEWEPRQVQFRLLDGDLKADQEFAYNLGLMDAFPRLIIYQGDRAILVKDGFVSTEVLCPVIEAAISRLISIEDLAVVPFVIKNLDLQGISILSAFYGKTNITAKMAAFCDNKKKCDYKASRRHMFDGARALPNEGPEELNVRYVCLNDELNELSAKLPSPALDQLLKLECPGGK